MKINLIKRLLLMATTCVLSLVSCKESTDNYSLTEAFPPSMTDSTLLERKPVYAKDGMMVLGKKLVNPYSVANMRRSLIELKEEWGLDLKEEDIVTTHLYVRFLPKDTAEYRTLEDLHLELFNRPLDYEILEEGFYRDPSLPDDAPYSWLYTTVSPDFVFPNVRYEILEECFIPDDVSDVESDSLDSRALCLQATSVADIASLLEERSLKDAGMLGGEDLTTRGVFSRKHPEGYFRVYNTVSNSLEGIEGVKVRCNTVVKWSTTHTDADGKYRMSSSFRVGPYYEMIYDNGAYRIFTIQSELTKYFTSGLVGEASRHGLGWHNKRGYDYNVKPDSRKWDLATMNNALHWYYRMCGQYGINTPPSGMRILDLPEYDESCSAPMMNHCFGIEAGVWRYFCSAFELHLAIGLQPLIANGIMSVLPDMIIKTGDDYAYRTRKIYSLMFHELSHASHYTQAGNSYWRTYVRFIANERMIELNKSSYGRKDDNNAGYCGVGECWAYAMEEFWSYSYIEDTTTLNATYPGNHDGEWFKPQVLWNVIQKTSPKFVFSCLTSDVNDLLKLRNRLMEKTDSEDMKIFIYEQFKELYPEEIIQAYERVRISVKAVNKSTAREMYNVSFSVQDSQSQFFANDTKVIDGRKYNISITSNTSGLVPFSIRAYGTDGQEILTPQSVSQDALSFVFTGNNRYGDITFEVTFGEAEIHYEKVNLIAQAVFPSQPNKVLQDVKIQLGQQIQYGTVNSRAGNPTSMEMTARNFAYYVDIIENPNNYVLDAINVYDADGKIIERQTDINNPFSFMKLNKYPEAWMKVMLKEPTIDATVMSVADVKQPYDDYNVYINIVDKTDNANESFASDGSVVTLLESHTYTLKLYDYNKKRTISGVYLYADNQYITSFSNIEDVVIVASDYTRKYSKLFIKILML